MAIFGEVLFVEGEIVAPVLFFAFAADCFVLHFVLPSIIGIIPIAHAKISPHAHVDVGDIFHCGNNVPVQLRLRPGEIKFGYLVFDFLCGVQYIREYIRSSYS